MSWIEAAPAIVGVVAILFVPGVLVMLAAGIRGYVLYAAAPAVSTCMVAALAIILPYLALPWTVLNVALGVAALVLIAAIVRLLAARSLAVRDHVAAASHWGWTMAGLVLAGAIITVQLVAAFGEPDNISQTFDASFHLNGTQYILDTANASSFNLSGLILPEGQSSLYPAAWHDLVSLGVLLTGASVPVSTNAVALVVAAVVWPSGMLLLVRTLFPGRRFALVITGVLSAAFPSFPLLPLDFGVLYPYFLGLAFLPAALAVGLSLTGVVSAWTTPVLLRVIVLTAILGGIGLAQPAIVFAWAALMVPPVFFGLIKVLRDPGQTLFTRAARIGAFAGALLALAVGWYQVGKMGNHAPWGPTTDWGYAFIELLTNSQTDAPAVLFVSLLVIVGLIWSMLRRQWSLVGMWAVAAVLFYLAAALPYGDLRNVALGLFYKDPPRLAALLPIVAVPVATAGAIAIGEVVSRLKGRFRLGRTPAAPGARLVRAVGAAVVLAVLVVGTQVGAMSHAVYAAHTKYAVTPGSPILSPDEEALLGRLDEEVPEDAVIVGNPWTGTALAYTIANRQVLNPHFNTSMDQQHILVNTGLLNAMEDPEVCDAVMDLDVGYLLDFGTEAEDAAGSIVINQIAGFEGLVDPEESALLTEVDREGDSVLYRIEPCR